jgi:ribosome-associated protein
MSAVSSGDDDRTARQISRSKQRRAGDRSAEVANALMKAPDAHIAKLEIDDDLRESIETARRVTSHIARRRAERTLAGDLRHVDIGAIEDQLERIAETGNPDARRLHLAEQWRTKLLEGGIEAAAEFPGTTDDELPRLINAARRERDTGKPPGAQKQLFRYIARALETNRDEP